MSTPSARRRLAATAAAVVALAALAPAAGAQSANITATATVLQPLTVSGVQNLDFGTVYPGVAKTIAPTDAGAGLFEIAGANDAGLNITLTLPANLAGPSASTLPVSSWTGLRNTTNSTAGGATFDPTTISGETLSAAGALYLFLGAQVTPTPTQTPGAYTGTITLTAAYTGS